MKRSVIILTTISLGLAITFASAWLPSEATDVASNLIHRAVSPGPLSVAHGDLAKDCLACHTPATGVDTAKCILCHANNASVLQRQPTAFHASIGTCKECHREHRGVDSRLSEMDHALLSEIGINTMRDAEHESEERAAYLRLQEARNTSAPPHARISIEESMLDCSTCHSNQDRHQSLFGSDCAQCHAADRWTIAAYKHPSPGSNDCSQCHQAPPSHYMMHFQMISARVAGKPHARVDQCQQCHQTTSWNDIKRVGWYKHH